MATALVRHDALLRAAVEGRSGVVFKTVGDAFCAVFADAEAALGAATDAQRALAAEFWLDFGPEFTDLRVRMGLHASQADERGGDYFGPALNRTARLMSAGHGGQVLLSLAAQQVVRDYLPAGVDLRDLGELLAGTSDPAVVVLGPPGGGKSTLLRSPYFLALLVEQVEGSGEIPDGRAALFTGFVRQALRRVVESVIARQPRHSAGHTGARRTGCADTAGPRSVRVAVS